MTGPLLEDSQWLALVNTMQELYRTDNEMAVNILDMIPSKSEYLQKGDVGESGRDLTVAGFKRTEIDGEKKVLLLFAEEGFKPLVLNKINAQRLVAVTGSSDTDSVKGKKINVYVDPMVEFGGKIVGGLRINKAKGAVAAEESNDDLDGEIPF